MALADSGKENMKVTLSVVLSFYNESLNLEELIRRLTASLEPLGVTYELIFVNDASTDHSLEILLRAKKADSRIKIINMSRNFAGTRQTACHLAGIENASGEAIVFMDTDLQDPPELIPQLLQTWQKEEADVVYTVRKSRAGESRLKLWITKWGYRIINWASEVPLPSEAGDFKLISRRIALILLKMKDQRPYLRGMVSWIGFKQVPVYYDREQRFRGKTKYAVFSPRVINHFFSALFAFSDFPLKLSILLGSFTAIVAFVLIFYALVCKFFGLAVPGSTGILVAVFLLSGIQLIMLGVVGLYVGFIFDQTRERPRYIIESKIGFEET